MKKSRAPKPIRIEVNLTPAHIAAARKHAAQVGLPLSTWIRTLVIAALTPR